jgi:hypothetical protein
MSLGLAVEYLESLPGHQPHVLTLPLSRGIRRTLPGPGSSVSAEELIISSVGSSLAVDFTIGHSCTISKCDAGVSTQLVAADSVAVDYIRGISDPSELPWGAITYQHPEAEKDAALFGAQLDYALQAYSLGDVKHAIGAMESAAPIAPSSLERVRLFALLGTISTSLLSGNIGQVQGLAFFHHAISLWEPARSRRRLTRTEFTNPVDRWLFDVFWQTFLYHQDAYPQWRGVFAYTARPTRTFRVGMRSDDAIAYTRIDVIPRSPEESIFSAERQRLREMLQRSGGDSGSLARSIRNYIGGSPDLARWVSTVLVYDPLLAASYFTAPILWETAVVEAVDLCDEPWRSQFRGLLSLVRELAPIYSTEGGVSLKAESLSQLSRLFSEYNFPRLARTFASVDLIAHEPKGTPLRRFAVEPSPPLPWWHRKYRDWFGAFAFETMSSIGECDSVGPLCGEFLERTAQAFELEGGSDRTFFAPGVALALGWSQLLGQPINQRWFAAYRDVTGMQGIVLPTIQPLPGDTKSGRSAIQGTSR